MAHSLLAVSSMEPFLNLFAHGLTLVAERVRAGVEGGKKAEGEVKVRQEVEEVG